jgi:hypothetical protein
VVVGMLDHGDPQVAARGGVGGADRGAVERRERDRARAAGEPHALDDLGDHADAGELVAAAGHDRDAVVVGVDVDRQRYRHVREDDRVVDRHQQEGVHGHLHLLTKGK